MTSHVDTILHFNKHNTTEFGLPVLDDIETNDMWWARREGVHLEPMLTTMPGERVTALVAVLDPEEPASSRREPDFCEDGLAFWLTPDAVVSVDVTRIHEVESILASAERLRHHADGLGWTRIHPSHYGIQVEWFDGSAHPAHTSWSLATQAIQA